ncbi:MAG: hypothetical protein V3W41_11000 [Planctomycetota bacterium]
MDRFLEVLRVDTNWVVKTTTQEDRREVRIQRKVKTGLSEVMGFAPVFEMPPTRRAPVAGIAVWCGGQENKRFTESQNVIGLADSVIANELDDAVYQSLWQQSSDVSKSLIPGMAYRRSLRKISFVLPLLPAGQDGAVQ